MAEDSLDRQLDACTERCLNMAAPLAVRLQTLADEVRRLSPEFADVVERMIARLKVAGAGETSPKPGEAMPETGPCSVSSDKLTIDSGYALLLNLAFYVGEEKRQAMTAAGWDITEYQGAGNWTLPIPATFVVGRDGIVKARFIDPDYRRRVDTQDILAALSPS